MTDASARSTSEPDAALSGRGDRWLATGGVVGALLASSCCVVPLVLVTLGVSGAWIGNLTALAPYKPLFTAVALVFIGLGFWQVYIRPKRKRADGNSCATPQSSMITKAALWFAIILTIIALTTDWWAPLFY